MAKIQQSSTKVWVSSAEFSLTFFQINSRKSSVPVFSLFSTQQKFVRSYLDFIWRTVMKSKNIFTFHSSSFDEFTFSSSSIITTQTPSYSRQPPSCLNRLSSTRSLMTSRFNTKAFLFRTQRRWWRTLNHFYDRNGKQSKQILTVNVDDENIGRHNDEKLIFVVLLHTSILSIIYAIWLAVYTD